MTHVLVFGSTGQLASELKRTEWDTGAAVTFLGRDAADFSAPQTLPAVVRKHRPDVVVIAAAYTAVDRAESEEALAHVLNAEAPGAIAEAAAERGAPVVFISTDYVFDGEQAGFYNELDKTNPLNAYGRSKLAGEEQVRAGNPRHLILRTSWLYSAFATNFVKTMIRLAQSRERVEVVADQFGCPTAAADFAFAIARLVPRLLEPAGNYGLYHLATPSGVSWYGVSEAVFRNLEVRGLKRPQNVAISSVDYPTAARRPRNSRLSSVRIGEVFGLSLSPFEASLPKVLSELLDG